MKSDEIATEPPIPLAAPATAGMTTRVVKGSVWMLAGQVVPLLVAFVTTRYVIRLLGEEGYGVLASLVLIPNLFVFADLGMSMASTKFGAQAFADGDVEKEGQIVRTAVLIAMLTSIPIAAGFFFFSGHILQQFNVPVQFFDEASLALKIASVTFLINFLCSIINTPQLSRLRMDLNTYINASTRVAGLIAAPIVIYLGYGLVGIVTALLIVNIVCLGGHILVSRHLLKGNLFEFSVDREVFKPLLTYGGSYIVAAIAGVILINGEKFILSNSTSTTTLGYYTISFALASMLTMFSGAIVQSLLPAFSQLQTNEKSSHLESLYSTGVRLNLIWSLPALVFLLVVARPFFTFWYGEAYGIESSVPFYILLAGVGFNILAYLPYSSIMASGRVSVLAKLFWIEVLPHLVLTVLLTRSFGIIGAATAWSIRAIIDSMLQFALASRVTNVRFNLRDFGMRAFFSILIFAPTVTLCLLQPEFGVGLAVTFLASLAFYTLFSWRILLSALEREWIKAKIFGYFRRADVL